MILINKLYGMIADYSIDISGKKRIGRELFGNKYAGHYSRIEARLLNHEIVIEDMEPQYRRVFTKLKNLL